MPILSIAGQAIASVLSYMLRGVLWLWPALLIICLLEFFLLDSSAFSQLGDSLFNENIDEGLAGQEFVNLAAGFLISTIGVISCRNIANNEWFARDFFEVLISGAFWKYLFVYIMLIIFPGIGFLVLIVLVGLGFGMGLLFIGAFPASILSVFLFSRLFLALPMAALGQAQCLRRSWEMTKSKVIRIAIITLLVHLFMGLIVLVLSFIVSMLSILALSSDTALLGTHLATAIILGLGTAVYVLTLVLGLSTTGAHIYIALTGPPPQRAGGRDRD